MFEPIGRAAQDANADQAWTDYADSGFPVLGMTREEIGGKRWALRSNALSQVKKRFFAHTMHGFSFLRRSFCA